MNNKPTGPLLVWCLVRLRYCLVFAGIIAVFAFHVTYGNIRRTVAVRSCSDDITVQKRIVASKFVAGSGRRMFYEVVFKPTGQEAPNTLIEKWYRLHLEDNDPNLCLAIHYKQWRDLALGDEMTVYYYLDEPKPIDPNGPLQDFGNLVIDWIIALVEITAILLAPISWVLPKPEGLVEVEAEEKNELLNKILGKGQERQDSGP